MVLLQDIEFIDRQIANIQREISTQQEIINASAKRGQSFGCRCDPNRPRLADCAACEAVNRATPILGSLTGQLMDLENEKSLISPPIQDEIVNGDIFEIVPIQDEITIIPVQQDNTLRNALIIGGALLLIL